MALTESIAAKIIGGLGLKIIESSSRKIKEKLSGNDKIAGEIDACLDGALNKMIEAMGGLPEDGLTEAVETIERFFHHQLVIGDIAQMLRGRSLNQTLLYDQWRDVEEEYDLNEIPDDKLNAALEVYEKHFESTLAASPNLGRILELNLQKRQADAGEKAADATERIADKFDERDGKAKTRLETLEHAYLNYVFENARKMTLEGIDPEEKSGERLHLDTVYTALLTAKDDMRYGLRELAPDEKSKEKLLLTAQENLNAEQYLALLGEAGSGKSTFVNFVALCLAGEGLGDAEANLKRLTKPLPFQIKQSANSDEQDEKILPQPWEHGFLIPVRIILRELANSLNLKNGKPSAKDVWTYVHSQLVAMSLEDFADPLKQRLMQKGGIILLDGLDEVTSEKNKRKAVKEAIEDFCSVFGKCRYVVTSRTYAYQKEDWRLDRFNDAVLQPFIPEQINSFAESWYIQAGRRRTWSKGEVDSHIQEFKRAIKKDHNLADLARRPLLLTLMTSLHVWRGGQLPENREELYSESVELLLDRWERPKIRKNASGKLVPEEPGLIEYLRLKDRNQLRKVLEKLAFEVHARAVEGEGETADIPEDELIRALMSLSPDDGCANTPILIKYLSERSGIIIRRGSAIYAFPHRTFQEYLAARYLTDEPNYPITLIDLVQEDFTKWREAWLLAAAKVASGNLNGVWTLADDLCDKGPRKNAAIEKFRAANYAALALVESADITSIPRTKTAFFKELQTWLQFALVSEKLPVAERAEVGRNLGILGDPRQEVMTLEKMLFCHVPGGKFWFGKAENDKAAYSWEISGKWHEAIIKPYWLARFPVTYAQFSLFVQEGGYKNPAFWTEAIELAEWKNGSYRCKEWDSKKAEWVTAREWRNKPIGYVAPFHLPNHPVVGVSWHEALAFCRWLTGKARGEGWISEDWQIRLPTEAEWEKAARGGEKIPAPKAVKTQTLEEFKVAKLNMELIDNPLPQRIFPWGDKLEENHCNYSGAKIGSTSAAGCFPGGASPYGCEEMSGSVWEWCATKWQGDYETLEDNDPAGEGARVVRGGSYANDHRDVRCSYRSRINPQDANGLLGFRILLSPTNR